MTHGGGIFGFPEDERENIYLPMMELPTPITKIPIFSLFYPYIAQPTLKKSVKYNPDRAAKALSNQFWLQKICISAVKIGRLEIWHPTQTQHLKWKAVTRIGQTKFWLILFLFLHSLTSRDGFRPWRGFPVESIMGIYVHVCFRTSYSFPRIHQRKGDINTFNVITTALWWDHGVVVSVFNPGKLGTVCILPEICAFQRRNYREATMPGIKDDKGQFDLRSCLRKGKCCTGSGKVEEDQAGNWKSVASLLISTHMTEVVEVVSVQTQPCLKQCMTCTRRNPKLRVSPSAAR